MNISFGEYEHKVREIESTHPVGHETRRARGLRPIYLDVGSAAK